MSYADSMWVVKLRGIDPQARAVLAFLADCRNGKTGRCNPSVETIAAEMMMGEKTARRRIVELQRAGLITRKVSRNTKTGQNNAADYTLNTSLTKPRTTGQSDQRSSGQRDQRSSGQRGQQASGQSDQGTVGSREPLEERTSLHSVLSEKGGSFHSPPKGSPQAASDCDEAEIIFEEAEIMPFPNEAAAEGSGLPEKSKPDVSQQTRPKPQGPDLTRLAELVGHELANDWAQHRREIRKKLTPLSLTKLCNELEPFTHEDRAAAINVSISNGYTGVFPKKTTTQPKGRTTNGQFPTLTTAEKVKFARQARANGY